MEQFIKKYLYLYVIRIIQSHGHQRICLSFDSRDACNLTHCAQEISLWSMTTFRPRTILFSRERNNHLEIVALTANYSLNTGTFKRFDLVFVGIQKLLKSDKRGFFVISAPFASPLSCDCIELNVICHLLHIFYFLN